MTTDIRFPRTLASVLFVALLLAGCAPQKPAPPDDAIAESLIEITAVGLKLTGPSEISSGWSTIRFTNSSEMVHFALLAKLPEGATLADHQEQVAPVFQEGMDYLNQGEVDSAMAAFGNLPEWFGGLTFMGGPGLASPGAVTDAVMNLEPGEYYLECYVKTNGVFHSYNPNEGEWGMVHGLTVTADSSTAPAPEPSVRLTISSENGIVLADSVEAGLQVFEVHFEDQMVHENFVGHDVHLARLGDTAPEDLVGWMNWSQPGGLETEAPVEFVGGLNEMPAGSTGYFSATVEPGLYALVSEVPNADQKNMLVTFRVP